MEIKGNRAEKTENTQPCGKKKIEKGTHVLGAYVWEQVRLENRGGDRGEYDRERGRGAQEHR